MDPVPLRSTRVLWKTSVWMLIPAYLSTDFLFKCVIRLTFIFSILHWYYYRMGSVYQALDCILSYLTLTLLALKSDTLWPLLPIVATFCIGHHYRRNNCFGQHLVYHVVFRALAFLWCCHYCDHVNMALWLFYVIIYALQVSYTWMQG